MTTAQLLRSTGLRQTRARRVVLELLNRANRPLSHQEIAHHPDANGLNRVTLYRTLMTLLEAGLLHRIQDTSGVWRFRGHHTHSRGCGGNHIHFLCLTCDRMFCLPEQPLPWIEQPPGVEVYGKQLVVYGRCARCTEGSEIETG